MSKHLETARPPDCRRAARRGAGPRGGWAYAHRRPGRGPLRLDGDHHAEVAPAPPPDPPAAVVEERARRPWTGFPVLRPPTPNESAALRACRRVRAPTLCHRHRSRRPTQRGTSAFWDRSSGLPPLPTPDTAAESGSFSTATVRTTRTLTWPGSRPDGIASARVRPRRLEANHGCDD